MSPEIPLYNSEGNKIGSYVKLGNLKEYLSEARTLNIKCLEKMSEGYFKGKVAGRIQMIDELITVIRILEDE